MERFLEYLDIEQFWLALDLILAALLGFFIGLERKLRDKEAGIRTHTIVSFGAALMMVISKYAFDSEADSARVAAQIVAGIGFLGAGIIVYKKNVVHGLTTAAGVWTTAGIGMACGGGLWLVAILATFVLVLIQWSLHRKLFRHKKLYSIKIVFVQKNDEREQIKKLFDIDRCFSVRICNVCVPRSTLPLHLQRWRKNCYLDRRFADNIYALGSVDDDCFHLSKNGLGLCRYGVGSGKWKKSKC